MFLYLQPQALRVNHIFTSQTGGNQQPLVLHSKQVSIQVYCSASPEPRVHLVWVGNGEGAKESGSVPVSS